MEKGKTTKGKQFYKHKKTLVELRLKSIVSEITAPDADSYNQALSHTLLAEAKRVRPIIAISVYEMFNSDDKILDVACSLELIHAASLILDDLPSMDDAKFRRGLQTSHLKFGESTAILASASLWLKAFDLIARADHPKAADLVRLTADLSGSGGVMLGQYFDLENVNKKPSIKELKRYYILKTSSMFRLAVGMGATLGNATLKQSKLLDKFGLNLGLAFQIRDDILDVIETRENTGKDTNKDRANENPNYVSVIGLDKSYEAFDEQLGEARKYLERTGLECGSLLSIIEKLRINKPQNHS